VPRVVLNPCELADARAARVEDNSWHPDSGGDRRGVSSFTHVGDQRHEPRALHGVARRALERRAVAAPLAGEHLALVGAELLQQADVLVIDVSRTRATLGCAEPAAVLAVATELFPRHKPGILGRNRVPLAFAGIPRPGLIPRRRNHERKALPGLCQGQGPPEQGRFIPKESSISSGSNIDSMNRPLVIFADIAVDPEFLSQNVMNIACSMQHTHHFDAVIRRTIES
jgi:hypothetical protein